MNKNLQDIDKLITKALKDYKEDPPENMWEQIENDLNRKDVETYKTKYKSLQRTLNCIILIFACLLLSGVLQFIMTTPQKNELNNTLYLTKNKLITVNNDLAKEDNPIKNKSFKENSFS